MRHSITVVALLAAAPALGQPQGPEINHDEAKVGTFTLPDPLVAADGAKVASAGDWRSKRRAQVLSLFETHVYGKTPRGRLPRMRFKVLSTDRNALGGKATRKEVAILFTGTQDGPRMDLLVYTPNTAKRAPAFLGLNFKGNHSVHPDPAITLPKGWFKDGPGVQNNRATEAARGDSARRWPLEDIIGRGFAVATAYYGDIDPDFHDGWKNGIHPLFYKKGQTAPAADEWGSIGAWSWGLSRALDYLQTDPGIDGKKVAVVGHSRLGKAALWAGAQDERFALVISNDSGEGGAALARRRYGETVARITSSFPHWFCANYEKYAADPKTLPVDQHMLLALVAPRPLYVASATEDRWADPRGEFLSAWHASPVWKLLGREGLSSDEMPPPDRSVGDSVGYHQRTGKHDIIAADWAHYMTFAEKHLSARRSAQR